MTEDVEMVRYHAARPRSSVETLGGLALGAGRAWLRTAAWGLGTSARLARAALDPEEASRLARELGDGLRSYAREALGVSELEAQMRQLTATASDGPPGDGVSTEALRARGAELLRRSAAVKPDESSHPAYAAILEQMTPEEARILRLLATEGDQPAVDVRSAPLIGPRSQIVAEGLNMIGVQARLRETDRVASHLNNLHRLGLIWFSKEPIADPVRYQALEAQPAVLEAVRSSGRTKSVHRSIRLTPFGQDFCQACLPADG
jgi:hypothetical protein